MARSGRIDDVGAVLEAADKLNVFVHAGALQVGLICCVYAIDEPATAPNVLYNPPTLQVLSRFDPSVVCSHLYMYVCVRVWVCAMCNVQRLVSSTKWCQPIVTLFLRDHTLLNVCSRVVVVLMAC